MEYLVCLMRIKKKVQLFFKTSCLKLATIPFLLESLLIICQLTTRLVLIHRNFIFVSDPSLLHTLFLNQACNIITTHRPQSKFWSVNENHKILLLSLSNFSTSPLSAPVKNESRRTDYVEIKLNFQLYPLHQHVFNLMLGWACALLHRRHDVKNDFPHNSTEIAASGFNFQS